jgi:hypothetical protein
MMRRSSSAIALVGLLVPVWGAAPVAAQAGSTFQIEVHDGVHQGTYEVAGPEPCYAQIEDAWSASIQDASAEPSYIRLQTGFGVENLLVDWSNGTYHATEVDLVAEDLAGGGAVLTVTATLTPDGFAAADDPDPVAMTIRVVCHELVDMRPPPVKTPAPAQSFGSVTRPSPVVLGSPTPGATTFHVDIESGPHAGVYDVWTLDQACARYADGTWVATYAGRETAPQAISIIATPDDFDGSVVTSVTVAFPLDAGIEVYADAGARIDVVESGESASLTVVADRAEPFSLTGEATEATALTLTVACTTVGS